MQATYDSIKDLIEEVTLKVRSAPGDTGYTPAVEEAEEEAPDVDRDTYVEAMDQYMEDAGISEQARAEAIAQLDAHGDYSPEGFGQNIIFVIENNEETINNHVDNSITLEEGAEVHDIHQANDTNQANATGDDAIAGRDQEGQFQTGDGVQSGDGNSGTVFQGENEGQVAGGDAWAEDITGDGGINVDGDVNNSGFGTGEGDVAVAVDQSQDNSTHDSWNQTDTDNVRDSNNTSDSWNTSEEWTETNSVDANLDVSVQDSFQAKYEEEGHDGYAVEEDDYEPAHDAHD
jgi:hypothetical protein